MLVDGKHYRTVWIEQAAREAAAASASVPTVKMVEQRSPSLFRLLRVFTSLLYCNATAHHGVS
jgi:hypothetical protein